MALIKYKPTSPGTRTVVKIDRSHLYKGGPYLPLTEHQNKTGARNHSGRITTRHVGGGSRQKYRVIDFKRDKDGIAGEVEVANLTIAVTALHQPEHALDVRPDRRDLRLPRGGPTRTGRHFDYWSRQH